MKVLLRNIQSIEAADYDLGDKGLVVIQGNNSNGKSILVKAISSIVNLKILNTEERETLISDWAEYGIVSMEYKGKALVTKIHRDRNQCVMQLVRENGEKIRREIRDGGLQELISEFGFCCYDKNSVCLQLYETFGPMPFVNTATRVNGEIVEDITEDSVAKAFLKNYKEITHPKAKEQLKGLKMKVDTLQQVKESLLIFDYTKYEEYQKQLEEGLEVLKWLMPIQVPRVNMLPNVEFLNVEIPDVRKVNMLPEIDFIQTTYPDVRKVRVPEFLPLFELPKSSSKVIGELNSLLDERCPLCGRTFREDYHG